MVVVAMFTGRAKGGGEARCGGGRGCVCLGEVSPLLLRFM